MQWFADTWFFAALLDRSDGHHQHARRIQARISRTSDIVTHEAVLTELLAHFSDDGAVPRASAAAAVRHYLRNGQVIVVDRELFLLGLDLYASRPDKEWSHVDCMSMVVMEQRGIRHVLTNDHHFAQAGFTIVNQ
ncbi:MAG TPA: PIN domain-containing protein [Thermoanaerobaculia bacterium]